MTEAVPLNPPPSGDAGLRHSVFMAHWAGAPKPECWTEGHYTPDEHIQYDTTMSRKSCPPTPGNGFSYASRLAVRDATWLSRPG